MIEIRELTDKEKNKHKSMDYVVDLGHSKQWFTKKAIKELREKIDEVLK